MLNEKGIPSALKEAYRKGGYRFVLSRGVLSVRTDDWGFQAALANVPPKVLGLITEHLGTIMEDGCAFRLQKDTAPQGVMLDLEATFWDRMRGLHGSGTMTPMKATPLTYHGFRVWQDQSRLLTRMVNPGFTRIVDPINLQEARTDADASLMLWNSIAGSLAYVNTEPEEDGLERLDGYPWCGEAAG